jgi:hypothetical protein
LIRRGYFYSIASIDANLGKVPLTGVQMTERNKKIITALLIGFSFYVAASIVAVFFFGFLVPADQTWDAGLIGLSGVGAALWGVWKNWPRN